MFDDHPRPPHDSSAVQDPRSGSGTIDIVLVDDHAVLREALAARLNSESDMQVVGEAGDADEGVQIAQRLRPQVLLMDIRMPGRLCFDAAADIKRQNPETEIIFLTAYASDRNIEAALKAGARGCMTKSHSVGTLVRAIRDVRSGRTFLSDDVAARTTAKGGDEGVKSRFSALSPRETEVLRYIATGMSKKQIAETMHISVKTVDNHATSLMAKLDLHDRVSVARYAIREGLSEA